MSDNTGIEWTDATWNPLVGCTKVSPGCDHCYAETLVNRFAGSSAAFPNRFDVVTMRDDKFLGQPLRWAKPRRVFVNSLSDLFHQDVPDAFIAMVFAVMAQADRHTFQLLTKRHARMRSLLSSPAFFELVDRAWCSISDWYDGRLYEDAWPDRTWPLPNVWLGVSVEDQHWADIRIPALMGTPAAVRFISAEPLLGPVALGRWLPSEFMAPSQSSVDWVIVGGESGPAARPMYPAWARDLRDQCAAEGVPFLLKQWGEWIHGGPDIVGVGSDGSFCGRRGSALCTSADPEHRHTFMSRVGKKTAGRHLDGVLHDGYPAVAS